MRFFDEEGAAVLIDPSRGDGGTIFVQSAAVVPPRPIRMRRNRRAALRLTTRTRR